jgi:hypothetical protein
MKKRDVLEDLGVGRRIMLKRIMKGESRRA